MEIFTVRVAPTFAMRSSSSEAGSRLIPRKSDSGQLDAWNDNGATRRDFEAAPLGT
jgi:hypothetical protein